MGPDIHLLYLNDATVVHGHLMTGVLKGNRGRSSLSIGTVSGEQRVDGVSVDCLL